MAEEQTQAEAAAEAEPTSTEPHGTDWKSEARKWERLAKANKAKADQWDAQEEAAKTEVQKATERADKLKAELDAIKAERERAAEVAKAAKEAGVDESLLARMAGDVAENAEFLKGLSESTSRYPRTRDGGDRSKKEGADGVAQAARMLFGNRN